MLIGIPVCTTDGRAALKSGCLFSVLQGTTVVDEDELKKYFEEQPGRVQ